MDHLACLLPPHHLRDFPRDQNFLVVKHLVVYFLLGVVARLSWVDLLRYFTTITTMIMAVPIIVALAAAVTETVASVVVQRLIQVLLGVQARVSSLRRVRFLLLMIA